MKCGPFTLEQPLARGGMAEVWRARHGPTRVAVKFVRLDDPRAQSMFSDEIRAHARLLHPHILQVLDMGTLDVDIEDGPVAGTLWMALEFASGGDLNSLMPAMGWPEIFVVLASILDGLAHAHSHGVIHRDLKPGNIVLATEADVRPGLKLADFGIAHFEQMTVPDGLWDDNVIGTKSSIAPEQCSGSFREFGPWTDLYAVGCLAYRLVSGRWPFEGRPMAHAVLGHLNERPPDLAPRFPVPEGMVPWVERLLNKAPLDRFLTAMDALRDLFALGPPGPPTHPALVAARTQLLPLLEYRFSRGAEFGGWRRPAALPPAQPLVDAGMGLFGLRAHASIGHETARDRLWDMLGQTAEDGQCRVMGLLGAAGSGVSHVGNWLLAKAREEGVAAAFLMRGFEDEPREQPLIRTLERVLRIEGLKAKYLRAGIEANMALHRHDDPGLTDVLVQILGASSVELAALEEALTRVLRGRLHGKPGVVFVDDVHAAPATLHWALRAKDALDLPLLIVLGTSRAPAVEGAEAVVLEPLSMTDFVRLCRSLLPTASRLEHELYDRTGGLSGLAVSRIGALVRAEELAYDAGGYRANKSFDLTDADGDGLGLEFSSLSASMRAALLRAAALGVRVSHTLWASAHDDPNGELLPYQIPMAGLLARHALLERLKRRGLAVEEGEHWRFTQSNMPASILARAPEPGEVRQALSDTADALVKAGVRLTLAARLLRGANRLNAALETYFDSISLQATQGSHGVLPRVGAEECLDLMDAMGIGPGDPRREWPHTVLITDLMNHPDVVEAMEETLELAVRHGWSALECLALALLERLEPRGRLPRALSVLATAEASMAAGVARVNVGIALSEQGRFEDALEVNAGLLPLADQLGSDWFARMAHLNNADSLRKAGRPVGVQHCMDEARKAAADGFYLTSAVWWVNAAEEAYEAGDLDASEQANLEGLRWMVYTPTGVVIPLVNLALISFERQEPEAMRGFLDRAWQAGRVHHLAGVFEVLEVCWASLIEDPSTFENRLGRLEASPPVDDPQSTALLLRVADQVPLPIWARRLRRLCEAEA